MKRIVLLLLPLLVGCQDYALNRSQLERDLDYVCATALKTNTGSEAYRQCRMYYDTVLLQYDVSLSRPDSWDVEDFSERSVSLANRCSMYSSNPNEIWYCMTQQEDMMLAEHVRRKLAEEEVDRQKEVIRAAESARADREVEVAKAEAKYNAKYQAKYAPKQPPHQGKPNNRPQQPPHQGVHNGRPDAGQLLR